MTEAIVKHDAKPECIKECLNEVPVEVGAQNMRERVCFST